MTYNNILAFTVKCLGIKMILEELIINSYHYLSTLILIYGRQCRCHPLHFLLHFNQ